MFTNLQSIDTIKDSLSFKKKIRSFNKIYKKLITFY